MNSSPPYRPMRSLARRFSAIVWATPRRTTSPAGVAVRVVDGLEVVDVDEGDAQWPVVAAGALDLGEQLGEQRLPIGDAGEAVDGRAIVRVGQGGRDAVDGRGQTRLEATAVARDRDRVVAGGDALRGPDQPPEADPDDEPRQRRGQGDAHQHRGGCGGLGGVAAADPRRDESRVRQDEEGDRDRSRDRQYPQQACHTRKATCRTGSRRTDRTYRPTRAGSTRMAGARGLQAIRSKARRRPVSEGAACYTPAGPRHERCPREPGGQRSRFRGASAVP